MCTYLSKRGATYYYRRVIPAELRPAFDGAGEFMFSLRTKDREEAKRKLPTETLRIDALVTEARGQLEGDGRAQAAAVRTEGAISERAVEQLESEARETSAQEARYAARALLRRRLRTAIQRSTAEITPEEAATRDLLREQAYEFTVAAERLATRQVLAAEARRGGVQADARSSIAGSALVGSHRPHSAAPSKQAHVPLLQVFDAYAAAQGLKAGTATEWRARMQDLIAFLGHDDAARISEDDVQRWRDHLLSQIVRGGSKRDPRTVRSTYITALRTALQWAVEERKLPTNVAASIVVRVPKKAKLRERDFTIEETTGILRAALQPSPARSVHRAFARRWIPWLCAYTGARVNEFSQLRKEDVYEQDGAWVVNITPEAGTVKSNVARTVPLHPHLIEQGFPAAISGKADGPLFYNPSSQRVPGDGSRHYKKVGERLAEWVRKDVGITDPNVQPNHGWRHTFKSMALSAGMEERVADYIQGHAPKTVGRTYGSIQMSVLVAAIGSLPRFNVEANEPVR